MRTLNDGGDDVDRAEERREDDEAHAAEPQRLAVAGRQIGQRHHAEEHHDGTVHGAELVVGLGQHDAIGGIGDAEEAPNERHRLTGIRKLPAQDVTSVKPTSRNTTLVQA